MKASTVARAARYVAVTFPEARDVAVSNLTMNSPAGEEDNVVVTVFIGQGDHLHVFASDDGSIAVGRDRTETTIAMASRAPSKRVSFVPAALVDEVVA